MDIKQKLNNKFKNLVKVPSNLSSGEFKPHNFRKTQINNLFNSKEETKTGGLADLNKDALSIETIKYIQEKHLPIVTQYTKQKELREMQLNPYLTNPKLEQEIINSIENIYHSNLDDEDKILIEDFDKNLANKDESKIELNLTDHLDPFEHILNKLPDTMDLGFILEEKKKTK